MAKQGYLTIRNLPKQGTEPVDKLKTAAVLKYFSEKYKKCPKCKGRKFTYKVEPENHEEEVVCIRIPDLIGELSNFEDVNTSDIVKDILLYKQFGKRPCKRCTGLGFTERKNKG